MLRRSWGWDLDRFLPQSGGQLRVDSAGQRRVSHGLGRRSVAVVWMLARPDSVRAHLANPGDRVCRKPNPIGNVAGDERYDGEGVP